MDLTILITSKARPNLLIRVIEQLESADFDGRLIIGDASGPLDAHQVSVRLQKSKLKNRFIHKENLSVPSFHKILSKFIETEYSLCIADGGVVFPQSLPDCLAFLDSNRDYVAVSGDVFLFEKFGTKKVKWLGTAPAMPVCAEGNPIRRFELMTKNYCVPMYCVMRASAWRSIWQYEATSTLNSLSNELLPAFHLFLFGKFGHINKPFLFREIHSKRTVLDDFKSIRSEHEALALYSELDAIASNFVAMRDIKDPNKIILGILKKKLISLINEEKPPEQHFRRMIKVTKKYFYKHTIFSCILVGYKLRRYRAKGGWSLEDFDNVRGLLRWLNQQD